MNADEILEDAGKLEDTQATAKPQKPKALTKAELAEKVAKLEAQLEETELNLTHAGSVSSGEEIARKARWRAAEAATSAINVSRPANVAPRSITDIRRDSEANRDQTMNKVELAHREYLRNPTTGIAPHSVKGTPGNWIIKN